MTIDPPARPRNLPPRVYLDANASERMREQARAALVESLDVAGNPASVHDDGRRARRILDRTRSALARRFGVADESVVLCSGGTEANALAVHGFGGAGRRVLVGATEHDAVRAAAGPDAAIVPVDCDGRVRLDALEDLLAGVADGREGGALVCLMHANNETGVIHPIEAAAALCRRHGARLHVDAVQSAGRLAFTLPALGASSVAISAHKLGGAQGAGALLLGEEAVLGRALFRGGGQELGRRGGTPMVAAIAAFGAALEAAFADPEERPRLAHLRDRIEARAAAAGAIVHGAGAPRLANTSCLGLPGAAAAAQLIALDLAGFSVSAGAACSSGKVARSHVLDAMDAGDGAGQAIRVSLPWSATAEDAERFADAYDAMAARMRASPPGFSTGPRHAISSG